MRRLALSLLLLSCAACSAHAAIPIGAPPSPLAHTYSIVARDASTGEMGVAVQSHYFSVGPVVPWAEAGVGPWPRNHSCSSTMARMGWH